MRRPDLQQCTGDISIGTGIASYLLGLCGVQGLAVFARTLHGAHHPLGGEDVQALNLGQVRGEHVREAAIQPVQRGILREIGEVKDGDGFMLLNAGGMSGAAAEDPPSCNRRNDQRGERQERPPSAFRCGKRGKGDGDLRRRAIQLESRGFLCSGEQYASTEDVLAPAATKADAN